MDCPSAQREPVSSGNPKVSQQRLGFEEKAPLLRSLGYFGFLLIVHLRDPLIKTSLLTSGSFLSGGERARPSWQGTSWDSEPQPAQGALPTLCGSQVHGGAIRTPYKSFFPGAPLEAS